MASPGKRRRKKAGEDTPTAPAAPEAPTPEAPIAPTKPKPKKKSIFG
jgi:hypothetical protein|tara:strand:- start:1920 stop:2060 length:141 start_codon:yes stop_codon:yes gene_type:complete